MKPSRIKPLVLFLIGIAITIAINQRVENNHQKSLHQSFDELTHTAVTEILGRTRTIQTALESGVGLFMASKSVEREEWRAFTQKIDFDNLPGALGLGYVEVVPPKELASFLKKTREDQAPHFELRQANPQETNAIIKFIEPLAVNHSAQGLNIFFETNRTQAARFAAENNTPAISHRVKLVQAEANHLGFLILTPIYHKSATGSTPEQRMNSLQGWTYAPVIIDEMLKGVPEVVRKMVQFQVFDVNDPSPTPLYRSSYPLESPLKNVKVIPIYNQQWRIEFYATPKFFDLYQRHSNLLILSIGTLISLLFSSVYAFSLSIQGRAQNLADRMTLALKKSEREAKKLALVASKTDNAVIIADADGKIEWTNQSFTRITGYSMDEVIGKKPGNFLQGPNTDPVVAKKMSDAIHNGIPVEVEILNYAKTGRPYWLQIEIQPIRDAQGRIINFVAIESDITEEKLWHEQILKAQKEAEAANRAKSDFLAVMSHEIRTPMNGVIGFSQLLQRTVLDARQKEFVDTIIASGESLLALINDILDFSKIEAGKIELDLQPVSIRGIIQDAVKIVSPKIAEKPIELRQNISPQIPDLWLADGLRLRQILLNLLGNAAKFTKQGHIEIRASVADTALGQRMRLEIEDTGPGIPTEAQARIFQAFSQADASVSRQHGGTGLGLAISRRLTEIMGGKISFVSTPGNGTTFTVDLNLEIYSKAKS